MSVLKLMERLRFFSNTLINIEMSDLESFFTFDLGLNWASLSLHPRWVPENEFLHVVLNLL